MRASVPALVLALLAFPLSARGQPTLVATCLVRPYSGDQVFSVRACSQAPLDATLETVTSFPQGLSPQSRKAVHLPGGGRCVHETFLLASAYWPAAFVLRAADGEPLATSAPRTDPGGSWRFALLGVSRADLPLLNIALSSDSPWMIAPEDAPDHPMAWQGLESVITTEEALSRLSPAQSEAIDAWVQIGGQLLLLGQRDPQAKASVRGLGAVRGIWSDATWTTISRSGAATIGGLRTNPFLHEYYPTSPRRFLIDRNARQRPPVRTIAAILGVFVLLVGPAQFVLLRRRPLHALWTFPALAAAALAANFAVGHATKGGTPRHDAVGLLELGSGGRTAALTRVSGLFVTEPGPRDVVGMPGVVTRRLGASDPVVVRGHGLSTTMTLEHVPSGLWDTLAVLETGVLPLEDGATITVERTSLGFAVENRTPWTLRRAKLGWGRAAAWLGELPPGRRVVVPAPSRLPNGQTPALLLGDGFWMPSWGGTQPEASLFAQLDPSVLPTIAGFERGRQRLDLRVVER